METAYTMAISKYKEVEDPNRCAHTIYHHQNKATYISLCSRLSIPVGYSLFNALLHIAFPRVTKSESLL